MANILTPHYCAKSIYDIPYQELKAQGHLVLFCDLDNTVTAYDSPLPDENFLNWVELRKKEGWNIYILSNNGENRVSEFCKPANLTGFSNLYKPLPFKTRAILKDLSVSSDKVVFIGDQVFTDVCLSNQLGFYSVLVDPVASGDLLKTKINRALEKLFRNRFIYGENKNW
jgi:hypothetical protein